MINMSDAFKEAIQDGTGRGYLAEAQITLLNGTVLTVASSQIEENGIEIEGTVSGSDSFSIGSANVGKLTLVINNRSGEFDEYDFFRAKVSVKVGLRTGANSVEYVKKGEYSVDDPIHGNGIITLECLDHMIKFDRPYSESKLTYPATLGEIVRDACDVCDVAPLTTSFDHDDYVVNNRPADEAITFRKVLSWAAQIACKWAKCNANGQLVLGWYDWEAIRGDVEESRYHMISRLASLNVTTDDVVITGVKVSAAADGTEEPESYLEGAEGYILSIEDNQLISAEDVETVASWLGVQLIGLRFRPFTAQHLSDPTIEAGDVVRIAGRNAIYYSVITSSIFSTGGYQESNCEAETPSRNSSSRYSESTKTYVAMRKLVRAEQTARETAVEKLATSIANKNGLYMTTEEMEDGSFIYYAHNKPTIEESDIIWLMTAEAIGISTDGGKTYPYGFVVDGELITRILQTEGINANWIIAGMISDKTGKNFWNLDTGEFRLSAYSTTEETKTIIGEVSKKFEKAVQEVIVEYAVTGSPTAEPDATTAVLGKAILGRMVLGSSGTKWSATPPEWEEGKYIWQRTTYVFIDGTKEVTQPVCITGASGQTSYLHVKYSAVANPTSSNQMTETPDAYMGTYTDFTEADSDDPADYLWYKVKGEDGASGEGIDGKTTYLHIKYSNDGGETFTDNNGEITGDYMGTYTDFTEKDSTDPADYQWYKIKGEMGASGKDAVTYRIESSLGTAFLDGTDEQTTLTARIYFGSEEQDADGKWIYTWYLVDKDESESVIGSGKVLAVSTQTLANCGVYFTAEYGKLATPVIYLEEIELPDLEAPTIWLEEVLLAAPVIYLETEKLDTPVIEIVEE